MLVVSGTALVVSVGYGLVWPWLTDGGDSNSVATRRIVILAAFAAMVFVSTSCWHFISLTTRVDRESVEVMLFPLFRERILLSEIVGWQVVAFNPMRDYGGWMLRIGPNRRALFLKGNEGVEIQLAQGPTVMVGSQRPGDLAAAIARAKRL